MLKVQPPSTPETPCTRQTRMFFLFSFAVASASGERLDPPLSEGDVGVGKSSKGGSDSFPSSTPMGKGNGGPTTA
ncbi:hypothetical protein EDD17DRAFT_1540923 [Pisolithus thermaeus]|nr:hypothetical protein EV401DRAFT_1952193 [Pisolithus croceorrhizus]KAI6167440.1 hypothetical protein EDD17DRAFT_1540923 [Pisolithus thermaeus]